MKSKGTIMAERLRSRVNRMTTQDRESAITEAMKIVRAAVTQWWQAGEGPRVDTNVSGDRGRENPPAGSEQEEERIRSSRMAPGCALN